MLHYVDYDQAKEPSHYEYYLESSVATTSEEVKKRAFSAMGELEGWCTELKASMLIDVVLLLRPQTVVEIGVFGGKSVFPMAFALKQNGHGKIYGIDPWCNADSVVGLDEIDKEWWGKVDHVAILNGLKDKIKQFELSDQIELIRATSKGADPIPNIDILHIDGNHSPDSALFDVKKWVPLVKRGGVIILDDANWEQTQKAVAWMNENCIKFTDYENQTSCWAFWIKS